MLGEEALDWLFALGVEIWITDMVQQEAIRDPDTGGDQRINQRTTLQTWFTANEGRINIVTTSEGVEYNKNMELWNVAGRPENLKPSWKGRGECSIFQVLEAIDGTLEPTECVIAIVDDRKARNAIRIMQNAGVGLMGTHTFLNFLQARLNIPKIDTAWQIIAIAADGKVPVDLDDDPVYIRSP